MQAAREATKARTRRSLLCHMRELLVSNELNAWAQKELYGIDEALRLVEATEWDPCPRCGKRLHV